MANLVIGAATGMGEMALRRFLGSLRATGYKDFVALLVLESDCTPEVNACFEKHSALGIKVKDVPFSIQAFRFFVFENFLQNYAQNFSDGMVLACDVRDLIFQLDPFKFPFNEVSDLYFFSENKRLKDCGLNSEWLLKTHGKYTLDELGDKDILCAGTIMGSFGAMQSYLKLLNEELSRVMKACGGSFVGIDQAIHNVIHYRKMLAPLGSLALNNEEGPVNTLHYAPKILDEKGRILNQKGEVSYVAHQIDRFKLEDLQKMRKLNTFPLDDVIAHNITYEL